MKVKDIKTALYRRFRSKFNYSFSNDPDRLWLDASPVGREFGSPDYARLEAEDAKRSVIDSSRSAQE